MVKQKYVTHVKHGLCELIDREERHIASEIVDCYVLESIMNSGTKIYVPVATFDERVKPNMTDIEAEECLELFRTKKVKRISNFQKRQTNRKNLLNDNTLPSRIELILDLNQGLTIYKKHDQPIANDDVNLLNKLVEQVSIEIANALAQDKDSINKTIVDILETKQ